ncbi:MAG: zinc ribbon domain-containing protein [Bacillota bacterium]|jgi:hypothetical protein|nr:zinc ribbon domain-containing protein [Bacillota bacterium]
MALIKCVECGKEISGQARYCPNCGQPSAKEAKLQKYKDRNVYLIGGFITLYVGIKFIYYLLVFTGIITY